MNLKYKYAIGCLVQWYEIEIIEEYFQSVKNSLDMIENKENVIIDICFNLNEKLEKVDTTKITLDELSHMFMEKLWETLEYDYNFASGHQLTYNV